ncbi:helix-turn-helix transcriptional regulator [Paraburkholderia sp. J8-2]|uniref:helix-turn-helix domain-containing protein n=1 Tax=Paraburkholderia sp. J8-2 TaxID=2805440 RepID=UPI002AB67E72|nr:helix-turn-helix transcriptional regulator [Paraburkholderia sp. J8-2]
MANTATRTPSPAEMGIGANIRTLRLIENIDQTTLAERPGVSRSALRSLEAGGGSSLQTFVSVLRALGRESWLDSLTPVAPITPMTVTREGVERLRATATRRRPARHRAARK